MLKTFLKHEIQNLLKSRRIYLTVIMFLLLFVSVFTVRVIDYQKSINQYIADVRQAEEALQNLENYSHINPHAIHRPLVFSIYNQGYKFNRAISIEYYSPITNSITLNEEKNKLFSENNQLDITFLITFFLSLFILLISYDSVNGEKQTGTLRLLLTFPVKRQSFILKKILGVFLFVAFTFTIPYIFSVLALVFIYANLLTTSFFLSVFFYWFLVLLFIFFFSMLGIFISTCTTSPNRSLVYCLLVWIMLSIILPISWDYIAEPNLFDTKTNQLWQIYLDKNTQAHNTYWSGPRQGGTYHGFNGQYTFKSSVFAENYLYESHYNFLRHTYENYYPESREVEHARDDYGRMRINIENTKTKVFFFNPIVLFNDIASKIAGNSRDDYLRFLQTGRSIRDDLISLGYREGWLFDYRWLAMWADENILESEAYKRLEEKAEREGWQNIYEDTVAFTQSAVKFSFDMPPITPYNQPNPSFGEIFSRIATVLAMFVISILALWTLTWYKFMKYDVR